MATKKKSAVSKAGLPKSVKIPTVWLIVASLLLVSAVAVKAIKSKMVQQVGINEVKTSAPQSGTYTGMVSRESTNQGSKNHERYFLTTDSGSKYMLIGLKTDAVSEPRENKPLEAPAASPVKGQSAQAPGQDKAKNSNPQPSLIPKSSPKTGTEDVSTFEQYVGKKVAIIGMVVPVTSDTVKASRPPETSATAKVKPGTVVNPEKSPQGNSGQNPSKPDTGSTQNPSKPMASASLRSTKPDSGSNGTNWEFDRLVVKEIAIVQ